MKVYTFINKGLLIVALQPENKYEIELLGEVPNSVNDLELSIGEFATYKTDLGENTSPKTINKDTLMIKLRKKRIEKEIGEHECKYCNFLKKDENLFDNLPKIEHDMDVGQ